MRRADQLPPLGILFDRDGTLIENVPFLSEPGLVKLMPTAAEAVAMARASGLRIGVATNQPGISTGRLERDALWAVNARVDELAGSFDAWHVCPHAAEEGCGCRKPRPGMLLAAAQEWAVPPERLAFVGDTAADVLAGLAVGARTVLVPNSATRPEEVLSAPAVAATLVEAVAGLLHGAATPPVAEPA